MSDEDPPVTLSVAAYNPRVGVAPDMEGGVVRVTLEADGVRISGDPAGLRDLARLFLALSDERAFDGVHAHMDEGVMPLTDESLPLLLERQDDTESFELGQPS